MNYLKKSFTVGALPSDEYRENFDRTFGKRPAVGTCSYCKAQEVELHKMCRICAKCADLDDTSFMRRCWVCGASADYAPNVCHEHRDVHRAPSSETQRVR